MSRPDWEARHFPAVSSNQGETREVMDWRLQSSPVMSNYAGYTNVVHGDIPHPAPYSYLPSNRDTPPYAQPLGSSSWSEMGRAAQSSHQQLSSSLQGPSGHTQAPMYHATYEPDGGKLSSTQAQYIQPTPPPMIPYGVQQGQQWATYPAQPSYTGSPRHDSMQTPWLHNASSMHGMDIPHQSIQQHQQHLQHDRHPHQRQQQYEQQQQMHRSPSDQYKRPSG